MTLDPRVHAEDGARGQEVKHLLHYGIVLYVSSFSFVHIFTSTYKKVFIPGP